MTNQAAAYPRIDGSQPCRQVDPEMFFPEKGLAGIDAFMLRTALALCDSCDFIDECLGYALTVDVTGIWGGTTQLARRRLRQQFGITATGPGSGLDDLLGISA